MARACAPTRRPDHEHALGGNPHCGGRRERSEKLHRAAAGLDPPQEKHEQTEEDQEYVGLCAEFPSLSWLNEDRNEAINGIVRVVQEVLEDMEKTGEKPPVPLTSREYSGELRIRMPPAVHQRLAIRAAEEKISLNKLILRQLV